MKSLTFQKCLCCFPSNLDLYKWSQDKHGNCLLSAECQAVAWWSRGTVPAGKGSFQIRWGSVRRHQEMCPLKKPKDRTDRSVCIDSIFVWRCPENNNMLWLRTKNCVASNEPWQWHPLCHYKDFNGSCTDWFATNWFTGGGIRVNVTNSVPKALKWEQSKAAERRGLHLPVLVLLLCTLAVLHLPTLPPIASARFRDKHGFCGTKTSE